MADCGDVAVVVFTMLAEWKEASDDMQSEVTDWILVLTAEQLIGVVQSSAGIYVI